MYLKVNNSYGFFMNNIYIYIYIFIGESETMCNGLSKQYSKHWKKVEFFFFLEKRSIVSILSEFNPTCE